MDWGLGAGVGVGEFAGLRDSDFCFGETPGVGSGEGLVVSFLSFGLGELLDAGSEGGADGALRDWDLGFGSSSREGFEPAGLRDWDFVFGETPGVDSGDGLFVSFLSFGLAESLDAGFKGGADGGFCDWDFGFIATSGVGEVDDELAGLADFVLRLGAVMIGIGRSTSSRTLARPIS